MKKLSLLLLIAYVAVASSVQAEESRLTIELSWHNLPRTDPDWLAYQEAALPNGGRILWVARSNGFETISIQFKQGFRCTTSDDRLIVLLCTSPTGSWSAYKAHDKPTQIEWVVDDQPVKGEKS